MIFTSWGSGPIIRGFTILILFLILIINSKSMPGEPFFKEIMSFLWRISSKDLNYKWHICYISIFKIYIDVSHIREHINIYLDSDFFKCQVPYKLIHVNYWKETAWKSPGIHRLRLQRKLWIAYFLIFEKLTPMSITQVDHSSEYCTSKTACKSQMKNTSRICSCSHFNQ